MKISMAAAAPLLLAIAATAGAVTFDVTNEASSTAGGQRFDREYGATYAKQVLSDASSFTWGIFNQPDPSDRRPADGDTVTLAVRDTDGRRRLLHQRQHHRAQRPLRWRYYRRQPQGAGGRGAVPRGGARVAVGAAGLRRALGDLRGYRGLRAAQGRVRSGELGEGGGRRPVGSGVRRDGQVPGLL
ncbi:hypothetical protein ACQJBY_006354 [Aegilops geniculata]